MNKNRIILILAAILLALSFGSGMLTHKALVKPERMPPDTVTVFREITVEKPVPVAVKPAPPSIPSVSIPKADLQPSPDSSEVQVQPEIKTYADSLESGLRYKIQVTGVGAELHSMALSWPERTVTEVAPFRGWSLDVVGHGLMSGFSQDKMEAFIGLEFGYTSDLFSFGIGPGARWTRPPGSPSHSAQLCVMGTVRIRLARFK